jgi:hypothetical protein
MNQNRIISLAKYKEQHASSAKKVRQGAIDPALPGADRLWELLDRNISLSVWEKGN